MQWRVSVKELEGARGHLKMIDKCNPYSTGALVSFAGSQPTLVAQVAICVAKRCATFVYPTPAISINILPKMLRPESLGRVTHRVEMSDSGNGALETYAGVMQR